MVTIRIHLHRLLATLGLPVGGHQRRQVVLVAHRRQAAEHVAQIRERVFAVTAAGEDYRVKYCRALSGVRMAYKQPVLFLWCAHHNKRYVKCAIRESAINK